MGIYSNEYRSRNMAVGNVAEHGDAWWATREEYKDLHFDGPIPLDVARELIGWTPIQVPMCYTDPESGEIRWVGEMNTDTGAYDGPMVVHRPGFGPIGYNGGATNSINYWDWFINGPAAILDTHTEDLNLGFVGLFKDGAVACVQIELARTIVDDFTGVGFRPFLYAATSLDGSLKARMGRAYTRIVCENTFSMALGESDRSGLLYTVKQTKNRRVDWNDARAALDIMHADADAIAAEMRAMVETTVTDRQWFAFLDAYVPMVDDSGDEIVGRARTIRENKRDALGTLWVQDMRVAPWKGTAFGVSQAVTTFTQNMATIKGVGRVERNKLNMISGKSSGEERAALDLLATVLAAA